MIVDIPSASAPIFALRPAAGIPWKSAMFSSQIKAREQAFCKQEVTCSIPVGSMRRSPCLRSRALAQRAGKLAAAHARRNVCGLAPAAA
jgi:hypothetical protein